MRNGMQINDGGLALDDLGDEEAAQLRAMGKVKAKGGAMFAASQQIHNPGGLEFTGDAARAVATRVANANVEKEKNRRRAQHCGGLLKARRPAGAGAAVAAVAAAAPKGAFSRRPSLQRETRSTKMRSPLYKRAFASSRPSARMEGRQLLMGSRAYSWSTANHRDPGVVEDL